MTGTNRERPGLEQALTAVRKGDILVVTKLDRLARSVPDVRVISDQLEAKGVRLALGTEIYNPSDPMGKMFFNIVATFAEFEADLLKMLTREGMAIAKAKGKMQGKKPKLTEKQQKELLKMHDARNRRPFDQRSCRDILRFKGDRLSYTAKGPKGLKGYFALSPNGPLVHSLRLVSACSDQIIYLSHGRAALFCPQPHSTVLFLDHAFAHRIHQR